ncbi:hypothetical protein [Azospirillum sp. TSO35-2]|uniref:hypothetical protein n=1 Tax=Azospirillum sp. TSO35-2 TaxID=716796 RepID=UPI000D60AEE5|nr:hypothetical protein [Azospirillum sp. TSO35-2]PWC33550.1 hypothetical protein TSO352_24270 [Azospirillum sp. TSO35-2]
MKELRCLVFTDQEVVRAVLDRRRRVKDPLPVGTVSRVAYHKNDGHKNDGHKSGGNEQGGNEHAGNEHGAVETRLTITDDNGVVNELLLSETEVTAALVAYCMGRRIPLPVASDKMLHLINGALTLMITMNFNKAPRLVVTTGAAADTPADRRSPNRRVGG